MEKHPQQGECLMTSEWIHTKSTSIQALRNVETHTYPRLTRLSKWATSALCFAGHITNLSERETVKEWLPSYREWLSQKFSLWSITKSGLEVRTCCKNGEFRTQATWLGNCEKPWRNKSNSVGSKKVRPVFQNQSSSKIWSYKGVRRTSMLSIFPRRSLKEESCSTEIFFSDM